MKLVQASVSQVEQDGDTFRIPYVIPCSRHYALAATVLYDLVILGYPWDDLCHFRELVDHSGLDEWAKVERWIHKHGRIIVDEWHGTTGFTCHVEPLPK